MPNLITLAFICRAHCVHTDRSKVGNQCNLRKCVHMLLCGICASIKTSLINDLTTNCYYFLQLINVPSLAASLFGDIAFHMALDMWSTCRRRLPRLRFKLKLNARQIRVYSHTQAGVFTAAVFALVFTTECDFNLKTIDGQWCIPWGADALLLAGKELRPGEGPLT